MAASVPSSASHVKHHVNEDINKYYEVKDILGTGAFSEVKRGVNRTTGEEVAIKIMTKSKDNRKMEIIEIEIEVLKRVNHPNVIKLYEIFDNRNDIALVLQLITGGELFERIVKQTRYSEADASRVVKQLLLGLAHLHERDIIHRDLKPENLLLSNHTNEADVVVTDFGLSAIKRPGQVINRAVGTPGYLAPEVLIALDTGKGYGEEVDMFGVGVITYILLCGFPPFYGNDEEEVYVKTETCDYSYPPEYWGGISERAKNLIDSLLTLDLSKRLTARQALQHPWIASEQSTAHLETALVGLKRFNAKRKFKGAIKGLLAINKMRRLTKSGTMLALIEKQLKQEIASASSTSLLPTVVGAGPGTSPFTRSAVVVTSGKVADAPSNAALIGILDRNNIPFALCRLSVEQNTDFFQSLFASSPSSAYPLLFVGDELVGGLGEIKSLESNGALVSTVTRKLGALPATNLDYERVTVEVIAGRKLARKDLFTSDPYLVFGVVDSNDSTIDQIPLNSRCFTSQIKMRTLNPKWNSVPVELTFPGNLGNKFVRVECWDYDQIGKDDFMGVVYVGISSCIQNEQALWYPFQARRTRKDKVSGDVQLVVSYEDNAAFRARASAPDGRAFLHARYATQVIQNQLLGNTRTDRQQVPARHTAKDSQPPIAAISSSLLVEKFAPGSALYGAVQLEECVIRELQRRLPATEGKNKWATSFTAPRAFAVRFNSAELRSDHTYLWHGVWLSPFDDEVHECLVTEVQNRSVVYTDDEQFAINEAGITDYICITDLTQSVRAHLAVKVDGSSVYCPRRFIRFSVDRIVGVPAMNLTDAVLVPYSVI